MIKKEKIEPSWLKWVKFGVVTALYLAFLYWLDAWWGIIIVPFIYDVYITKKIKWQWWKEAESPVTRFIMSWVDALVFALVAVYFINIYFFQNYEIPSSSLEKSLLTGDYLFVSKMSYGPRVPQTPLTMPLTQHTLPVVECKSYIEWPQWEYKRAKGFGKVKLNDIVVFNYPAGDTLCSDMKYQAWDYYQLCYAYGYQIVPQHANPDSLSPQRRLEFFNDIYEAGKKYIAENPGEFGKVITRPADRRENYVKRCVGLPGQTLQIKNGIIYNDGKANKEPERVQYTYRLKLTQNLTDEVMDMYDISYEDIASLNQNGYMPLTKAALEGLKASGIATDISRVTEADDKDIYPLNGGLHWTRDNYGPVWIPAKGKSIKLTMDNIAIYERPIRTYEGNDLKIKGGKIYINGKETTEYTFKMDYYWMQGDNRHNSLDSRYWGFVPEDHIVGKPIFVWLSINPDTHKIRWNRLFSWVDDIK